MPEVTLCEEVVSRTGKSNEEIKTQLLDLNVKHSKHKNLFTDDSKSEDGVGCAVVHNGTSYAAKLPKSASIFTAKITAIIKAFEIVYHSKRNKFVIYSDSKNVLASLRKYNVFHPLIQKVQECLFRIFARLKSVSFCWVPAHVGIRGNEQTDQEAKKASAGKYIDVKKIPHSYMKRPIKSYILKKCQGRWSSPLLANNKKYKEITSSITT